MPRCPLFRSALVTITFGLYPVAICTSCNARWIQDGHQQRAISKAEEPSLMAEATTAAAQIATAMAADPLTVLTVPAQPTSWLLPGSSPGLTRGPSGDRTTTATSRGKDRDDVHSGHPGPGDQPARDP